jgi:UPF0176 protein
MNDYLILLYYCYTKIEDPEDFRGKHHLLCLELNLRGRVIVAAEGINGTVSGLRKDCEKYMEAVKSDARFDNIEFKIEEHHENGFQKLHVRMRDEIVHSGLKHIHPNQKTGLYIEPAEFRRLKDSEEVVILDVRSNFEHHIGKFKNAITLDIENFRDFPGKIKELEQYKSKKIITYCTGGIKCEKASSFLLEQGFKDVYQLHGGVIKYGIEEQGADFEGKCYVFDNRIAVDINKVNPKVVSVCIVCGKPSDRMVNCANTECNKHAPVCQPCSKEMEGACSDDCRQHPAKREYNDKGYYPKKMNGYNPYKGLNR